MPKVQRNDPCPCGSGKKYKQCCMLKERAQLTRTVVALREHDELFSELLAFAKAPALVKDMLAAFESFWNGDYGSKALWALPARDVARFMDWFLFDYPTWDSRKRVIELFAETEGPKLSAGKQEMLTQWLGAVVGFYRVKGLVPNTFLRLEDLVQGEEVEVIHHSLSLTAAPGDLLVSRVLDVGSKKIFSNAPILLPPSMEPGVMAFLERAWRNYRETHSEASRAAFLREVSHLFNHYLLQVAQSAEASLPPVRAKYYSAAEALEALQKAREERDEERQAEAMRRRKELEEKEPSPAFQTIADGRLVVPKEQAASRTRPTERYKTIADGKLLLP